jgi:hypothetical protein
VRFQVRFPVVAQVIKIKIEYLEFGSIGFRSIRSKGRKGEGEGEGIKERRGVNKNHLLQLIAFKCHFNGN